MFEFLDKPRQALSNMVSGIGEGDIAKAAPGLLGLLSGGLAATGVGIPLSVLIGSAAAGLGQGIGESIDPSLQADSSNVAGGKMASMFGLDPDSTAGQAVGVLGTALTDPMSYAGLGLGSKLGARAGAGLERAAIARGPRYGTTAEDLLSQIKGINTAGLPSVARTPTGDFVHPLYNALSGSPHASQIAAELQPGAKIIKAGGEGVSFLNPTGDVTRIGITPSGFPGRPMVDEMLQPTRSLMSPGQRSGIMTERVPFLTDAGSEAASAARSPLADSLREKALNFSDMTPENVGFLKGSPKVLDPTAVKSAGFTGDYAPMLSAADQPSRPMNAILSALGSDRKLRAALANGRSGLGWEQQGSSLGAKAGALGSLLQQAATQQMLER